MNSNSFDKALADNRDVVNILDFPMDVISYSETLDHVIGWIRDEDRTSRILLTVNASLLVACNEDEPFRHACDNVDLSVPDGVPVIWLSKLLGTPLKERVAGVDLMYSLMERGHQEKLKMYLLGATQAIIDQLKELCAARFPDLVVVGARNGYFDESEELEICEAIRDSNADMLFIGMPSPRKELFAEKHRELINVPLIIGVGGSFDVITGKVRRAPETMQRIGMEWMWRLLMEPRKLWRRYLRTNSIFIWMSIKSILKSRFGNRNRRGRTSGPIL